MSGAPEPQDNPVDTLAYGWRLLTDVYHALPPGYLPYLHAALAGLALMAVIWFHQAHQKAKAARARRDRAAARQKARSTSRSRPRPKPSRRQAA